ncbi:MAG: PHP domain-containing protein [Planctomycetia bacterium]|nr:PHP domain-containing protein [Planctomycetia bacterium]
MNNNAVSDVVNQTARLLEFREGASRASEELTQLAARVKNLEVPLEIFNGVQAERDLHELDQMLGYWFSGYTREAIAVLRETILTGAPRLKRQLAHGLSASMLEFLALEQLPLDSIVFIRERLAVRSLERLRQVCERSELFAAGVMSEQTELDVLEELVRRETERSADSHDRNAIASSDQATLDSLTSAEPSCASPDTIFWANADALADAVIFELSRPYEGTLRESVTDLASADKLGAALEQAAGVVDKFKRFFVTRQSSAYAQIQQREEERERQQARRRFENQEQERFDELVNGVFETVKVGALRRREDMLTRLDFLTRCDNPAAFFARIKKSPFCHKVLEEKPFYLAVQLLPNFFVMPYNNRPTPPATLYFYVASDFVWGVREALLTSTPAHWKKLKARARDRGMNLTPFGLYERTRRLCSRTEKRLYEKLNLPYIPVELRADAAEWKWIAQGEPQLIQPQDLQGDLHLHTTFTDGSATLEEMANNARALGLHYMAATDHTQNVAVAGGMNDVECLRYWEQIDQLNERLASSGIDFHVLKGIECDILEAGGMDLKDETLAKADWVIASIHYGKRQSRELIHRRYLDAFRNPYVDIIAHPTGRMIGIEPKIDVDIEFLCQNAAKYGKCLELNCQPRRLDLDRDALMLAKEYGVPIVISTDSHNPQHALYLNFGVYQAQRAGLVASDVLNTLDYQQFVERRRQVKAQMNLHN